jgi:hypothetical protein
VALQFSQNPPVIAQTVTTNALLPELTIEQK